MRPPNAEDIFDPLARGAKFPIDALRNAGVDMQSPGPIEKAMDLFQKRIE
jgi:oligoendopeptidase F